ncbi:MAG TPA: CopG family transcriptional regulator [Nitrospiraceae bacterium]|jgi:predicted transcriptional regulator|nr:CopG family transcriptional regulator [Nitrospiraceae bacterium]
MSSTITIRVEDDLKERLVRLSKATDRTISYLLGKAIEEVLEVEEWQVGQTKKAIEKADKLGAKFVDHSEVEAWLKTWGTKKEGKPPKCA